MPVRAEACVVWYWTRSRDHHFILDLEGIHGFCFSILKEGLCNPRWIQIYNNLPASVSLVLGLQERAIRDSNRFPFE